jgi:hypothetical protein
LIVGLLTANVSFAYAIQPVITNNVHVIKNTTPTHCPSSWRGNPGSADVTSDTGRGASNFGIGVGVQSCDSCAYDSASGDCVCGTCYGDYN